MSSIPRVGVEALMPEEYQKEIIENVSHMSSVMSLGRRLPDMIRSQKRMPILSSLPTAYFSNPGPSSELESGQWKRTTTMEWENKYIDAEELNVIVAIPESVFDDSAYDIWNEAKPKLLEAFGLAFDQAVFYGTNAPQIWPDNIVAAAIGAGNFVSLGSLGDIYNDIMATNGLIAKVEESGYMCTGHVGAMSMRGRLRGLRDNNGNPIFKSVYKEGAQGATRYELDGEQIIFPRNGAIIPSQSLLISGEWNQLVYAIRKDITWKVLTEAVIQNPTTGDIEINLAQQNYIALRASMRLGWQVPNPINRIESDEDERYPFSVLGEAGS